MKEKSIGLAATCGMAAGLTAIVCFAAAAAAPAPAPPDPEPLLKSVPTPAEYGRHLRFLTEEPHATGTPRNMALADYVRDRFVEYGLEDVTFHDSPALLASPRSALVEIVAPDAQRLKLAEDPFAADKDSHLYRDPAQVAFHAYAPSGDATAEVVYANSGSPEDFAALERMEIEVRGRIVLMRYSEPYSYRGYKLFMAESHGALAAMIYSDPFDDGYFRGETYPEGPWGPMSHVQWGAVLYDWLGPGEPFTFHWTRSRNGAWREGAVRDRQLPKIPSLPLSPEDAAVILSRLRGPVVPAGWQGALPFTYHVGPGPVVVHVKTETTEHIGTMRSVIGRIRGREEPDRWVILGNHRDAWIYGAVDPSSGTAALLETARAMGTALKSGLRPRRTIVFANWDAEEQLLGGSTQWVVDNRDTLRTDAVASVNVDSGVAGSLFEAGATPALADFVRDVSAAVDDPATGAHLRDAWAARGKDGVAEVGTIVGATDYTAFQEHLGVSCIDMDFGGDYGVYHSMYDDFYWMSHVGDPGFRYGATLARLWPVLAWRLADAPLLPLRFSAYARAVQGHIDAIEAKAKPIRPLRLDAARAAAKRWEEAAAAFEARAAQVTWAEAGTRRAVNDLLVGVERVLTEPAGLKSRPFFKHLIYAPQPTYREEVLPRIFEAIEAGEWDTIPRYEAQLVAAFDHAAAILREARERFPANGVAP